MVTKRHGWLTGALLDAGYQQQDLAKAWGCDNAVVSRFITSGKPDLTPERQMILSQILNLTNDELLAKLYGSVVRRSVSALPLPAQDAGAGPVQGDVVQQQIAAFVRSMQQQLPGARVTVSISYD